MSWRTVVISERSKLDFKMNYMVVRGTETTRFFIDEISVVIIESQNVSMTAYLLSQLTERNVKIIFCADDHTAQMEVVPFHGNYNASERLQEQISWRQETKEGVWRAIVGAKIRNQSALLREIGQTKEADQLLGYIAELKGDDDSNREGHAAKVYFNALFGKKFTRDANIPTNAALDYGYAILRGVFNREIVANGYVTQLGIHHRNVLNYNNFTYDLMEPMRPYVDRIVKELPSRDLDADLKETIVKLMNLNVHINDGENTFLNTIRIYVRSVFDALNSNDPQLIKFNGNE
ncbi:MAG: type II CRISPR-associated endonuclease Cas1 [Thermoguttaceae bacterium]